MPGPRPSRDQVRSEKGTVFIPEKGTVFIRLCEEKGTVLMRRFGSGPENMNVFPPQRRGQCLLWRRREKGTVPCRARLLEKRSVPFSSQIGG